MILRVPLSQSEYIPIVAPVDCDYFAFLTNEGGGAVKRSSNGTDANSYSTNYFALIVPCKWSPRFHKGDVVTYLKGLTDNGPAIIEFY